MEKQIDQCSQFETMEVLLQSKTFFVKIFVFVAKANK